MLDIRNDIRGDMVRCSGSAASTMLWRILLWFGYGATTIGPFRYKNCVSNYQRITDWQSTLRTKWDPVNLIRRWTYNKFEVLFRHYRLYTSEGLAVESSWNEVAKCETYAATQSTRICKLILNERPTHRRRINFVQLKQIKLNYMYYVVYALFMLRCLVFSASDTFHIRRPFNILNEMNGLSFSLFLSASLIVARRNYEELRWASIKARRR